MSENRIAIMPGALELWTRRNGSAVRLSCENGRVELALGRLEVNALILALSVARIELWPDSAPIDARAMWTADDDRRIKTAETYRTAANDRLYMSHEPDGVYWRDDRRRPPFTTEHDFPDVHKAHAELMADDAERRERAMIAGALRGKADSCDFHAPAASGGMYRALTEAASIMRTAAHRLSPDSKGSERHVNALTGADLDKLGAIYGIIRVMAHPETDAEFRARLLPVMTKLQRRSGKVRRTVIPTVIGKSYAVFNGTGSGDGWAHDRRRMSPPDRRNDLTRGGSVEGERRKEARRRRLIAGWDLNRRVASRRLMDIGFGHERRATQPRLGVVFGNSVMLFRAGALWARNRRDLKPGDYALTLLPMGTQMVELDS